MRQAPDGRDRGLRRLTVGEAGDALAQRLGHAGVGIVAGNQVPGHHVGQEDGIRHAVRDVEVCAQRMRHGVDVAQARARKGHRRHGGREQHCRPGADILPVRVGGAQGAADEPHRFRRQGLGDGIVHRVHVAFDRVGQRVHPGRRRQWLWHRQRELGITQADLGNDVRAADGHLEFSLPVCDDGEDRYLAARAGGGGNRYHRDAGPRDLADALVVGSRPTVRGQHGDHLADIHRTAAPHGHDKRCA